MKNLKSTSGFSLIEVLLAVALFGLILTGFVGAFIYGQQSTALAGARSRAVFLAEEGLEAVRNIRDEDFVNLIDGTYGLAISGNQWNFSGNSDTSDIFTREIEIATIDDDRKLVISKISWQQNLQRLGEISLQTYLTNWQAVVSIAADNLNVDIFGVGLAKGNKNVTGITLENSGDTDITISQIIVSWTNAPNKNKSKKIIIDSSTVWQGSENSGEVLDIDDFTITAGVVAPLELRFSKKMKGAVLGVTLIMLDSSTQTISGINLN
jgi:prepilin-type N-terminal cleavage/methylation domain-containing protein